jgi:GxxExxY protein
MIRDEVTYRIIGCGCGFPEIVYQRSLAIEMKNAGMNFESEVDKTIYYEKQKVGTRRADFVVEGKVIVELKAFADLENAHLVQAKNYVTAYDFPLGLLINFGAMSLQYKLIFNPKYNVLQNEIPNSGNP